MLDDGPRQRCCGPQHFEGAQVWQAVVRDGRGALLLVCACYQGFTLLAGRLLIAAPRHRQLLARVRSCRARIAVLAAGSGGDPLRGAELAVVTDLLDGAESPAGRRTAGRAVPGAPVTTMSLSKLAAGWRSLHGAERRLLLLEAGEETEARVRTVRLRLVATGLPADASLAAELAAASTAPGGAARPLLVAATELLDDREDGAAEREYEQQRVALWLAATGLGVVLVVGLVFGNGPTLLVGALGGFLSPLVGAVRSQRPSPRGVPVLAPVGGALAAVGGLLLVRTLADPRLGLLGEVFLENSWGAPARPIALAIALLSGLSGGAFARLALAAAGRPDTAPGRGATPGQGAVPGRGALVGRDGTAVRSGGPGAGPVR
ncbi:hypothetical protein KNE206_57860 [Kitasatospora sp. NE20-6]